MAATKQELVRQVSLLPIDTIQKLLNYANLIMIPDENLVSSVTMKQLVDKAHELANIYFPEWTDRSKSDFGEFLVELFAIFSEKDFWYINAFANESILQKMRSYSNAYMKAISMGYKPQTITPASMTAKISFRSGKFDETIPIGGIILSVGSKQFFNNKVYNLSQLANYLNMDFSEGTHNTDSFIFNGYNIFIKRQNVNPKTIEVYIDGAAWERVDNFANASKDSKQFMVIPEDDSSVVIYFGTNGVGKTPDLGASISVTYDICSGSKGNIDYTAEYSLLSSATTREATLDNVVVYPKGGTDSDSLQQLVASAQQYNYNHGAVINVATGEAMLNSYNFVYQSKIVATGLSLVYYIIPYNFTQPTDSQKSFLAKNFEPRVLMGYSIKLQDNNYVGLLNELKATKIRISLYVQNGYSKDAVKSQAVSILQDFTNPLAKATYGGSFKKSEVDSYMRSEIPGLTKATFQAYVNNNYVNFNDVTLNETQIFATLDSSLIETIAYDVD